MAMIEKAHDVLEASSPSYYYHRREEDSGIGEQFALILPVKPRKMKHIHDG